MQKQKNIAALLIGALVWCAPVLAEEPVNLLANGSFEEYSCNMLGCAFDDWSTPLGSATANSDDKIDGEVSLQLNFKTDYTIDNSVSLGDDQYEAGTGFKIVMYYKVTAITAGSVVKSDCYWGAKPGADEEQIKAHDADILTQVMADTITPSWDSIVMETTKPEKSSSLRVRVFVPKGTKMLLDAFRVEQKPKEDPQEPFISVTPKTLSSVSCELGDSVAFQTIHLTQGYVQSATTFYIGGEDRDQFVLSASELSADQSELDIIVTYKPTEAGTHSASLIFDNSRHTTILPSLITLRASCTDPTAVPTITVTPEVVPTFETVAGKQISGKFTVKSVNCTDFLYLKVDHQQGEAFTIVESMLAKNYESEVTVYFTPLQEGTYQSTVTITSENAAPVVVTLNGIATAKSEETIDWKTRFVWDTSQPKALLNEDFASSQHNETLVLDGWQNVAPATARPWWGYDENRATPPRADNKCAKATAYQYGKDSTGIWEMWLVTPALDYKNAGGKVFTFDVMAEYLPEDGSETTFEVYFIDSSNGDSVWFQNLTGSFAIPTTGSENEVWRTFHLNLSNQPNIPDVFFMAFRYAGPNGAQGVVTYYVDNISWGRTDLPTITPNVTSLVDSMAIVGEEREIGTITIQGENLTGVISLAVDGPNYNRFELSATELPAAGGEVTVRFTGEEEGVHQAYIRLSSKGAAEVYIPMAVLCRKATAIDEAQREKVQNTKVMENGVLYLMYKGRKYNVQGTRVR